MTTDTIKLSYYQRNKEKQKAYLKQYNQDNYDMVHARARVWRKKNKIRINIKSKKYCNCNKQKLKESRQLWMLKNIDKIKKYYKIWRNKHRQELAETYKKQGKIPEIMAQRLARIHVHRAINIIKQKKIFRTMVYIGCSVQELKEHIENQFKQGMTWNNHGQSGWHLDHIIPLCNFHINEIMHANHYTNLQPLWAVDNLSKGSKL